MYNVVAEFVTWLFDLAVSCFFPGASYQRQKTGEDIPQCSYSFLAKSSNFVDGLRIMFNCFTAMQLLVAILDVFSVKWQPDKKKGQPPGLYVIRLVCVCTDVHGTTEFLCLPSCLQLK